MIFDENELGKMIDIRYVNDTLITRYKLVCENDVDITSLPEEGQGVMSEFIEIGLRSITEEGAIQEVKTLLEVYRKDMESHIPEKNFELLINRIDYFSGHQGRPEETVIKEHLVGTSEEDPVVKKMLGDD